MFNSKSPNLERHSKKDLRQRGAAAVFRAACSIRRSTAGRVKHTVIHLYVLVYTCSVIFRALPEPRPGPRTRTMKSLKSYQNSTLIFDRFLEPKLGQNGSKLVAKILPKSIQNLIDFLIDFGMRF